MTHPPKQEMYLWYSFPYKDVLTPFVVFRKFSDDFHS